MEGKDKFSNGVSWDRTLASAVKGRSVSQYSLYSSWFNWHNNVRGRANCI